MVTAGPSSDRWDNDMSRRLVLNLSPIQFGDAEVRVGILEYQSKEQLQALRAAHFATHIFRPTGKRLLCVPVVPEAPEIGGTFETIRLAEELYLCARLIRNALLNHLHKLGRKILDYDPIKFIADGSGENLLAASIPPGVSSLIGLSVRPFYEVAVRVIRPDRQPAFVGLAVNVRATKLILQPCDELLASGFPLAGLYVGRLVDRDDTHLAPRFELQGRVKEINNQRLLLDDARPGVLDIDAKAGVLEPRADYFALCLAHVFREHAPRVKQSLRSSNGNRRGKPWRRPLGSSRSARMNAIRRRNSWRIVSAPLQTRKGRGRRPSDSPIRSTPDASRRKRRNRRSNNAGNWSRLTKNWRGPPANFRPFEPVSQR